MNALFKAEFLRYRKWALLALLGQLAALAFISRIKPLLISEAAQHTIITATCVFGGLALGIIQMQLNRRKNNWTWLIQRPLSPPQIYTALSLAAIAAIIVAVPAGWLIVVAGIDLFSETVVDTRHYVSAAYMAGLTITSYLIGSLTVLSASRGAILTFIIIFLWVFPKPQSMTLFFAVMGLISIGLWYLNLKCFKPDLSTHVKSPVFAVLLGLPIQASLALALLLGSIVYYHIPLFLFGNHPDSTPIVGTLGYLRHVDDDETLGYLLKDKDFPGKDRLIRRAQLAESNWLSTEIWPFPSRGQMYNWDKAYSLYDPAGRTNWMFAHDEMMLKGVDRVTGSATGWLGQNGFISPEDFAVATPFDSVPFMVMNQFLVTEGRVYQASFEDQELIIKFAPPAGERVTSPPIVTDNYVAIITDASIYLFDKEAFLKDLEPAIADYVINHPIALEKVRNIETRRMVDGYLVLYFSQHYAGFQKAGASIHYAKLDKGVELIARINFPLNRHPALIDNLDYTLSPALYMLTKQINTVLSPQSPGALSAVDVLAIKFHPSVRWTALGLMLISGIIILLLARRNSLPTSLTAVWTVMGAAIGLPALISFILMNKVRLR